MPGERFKTCLEDKCLWKYFRINFFKLGFTPCKAEQPLQGMELKEKEKEKDENHIGELFIKNPKINCVY